jgi:hypothetical protein
VATKSDTAIVIVSRDQFRNGHSGHVPYGTILADDDDEMLSADSDVFESFFEGAVPAVDWRGLDTEVAEVSKKKPGRPKKNS